MDINSKESISVNTRTITSEPERLLQASAANRIDIFVSHTHFIALGKVHLI